MEQRYGNERNPLREKEDMLPKPKRTDRIRQHPPFEQSVKIPQEPPWIRRYLHVHGMLSVL